MTVSGLSEEERSALLAVAEQPMLQQAVDERISARAQRALLFKRLIEWRQGYLDVAVLAVTDRGAAQARRLRG